MMSAIAIDPRGRLRALGADVSGRTRLVGVVSWVLLAGDFVYKLKKPLEKRLEILEEGRLVEASRAPTVVSPEGDLEQVDVMRLSVPRGGDGHRDLQLGDPLP